MARPRDEVPYGTYHVWSRGSNQHAIALDTFDRRLWISRLGGAVARFEWALLAFCLLTNHFHLLLRIQETGLSRGMQWLNGGFARTFNIRHDRSAHVFRNRFSSRLVESDDDLLTVCRYIERNPVEAGLCRTPDAWRWSSHRATAGIDAPIPFLARAELLGHFGPPAETAALRYREFIRRTS